MQEETCLLQYCTSFISEGEHVVRVRARTVFTTQINLEPEGKYIPRSSHNTAVELISTSSGILVQGYPGILVPGVILVCAVCANSVSLRVGFTSVQSSHAPISPSDLSERELLAPRTLTLQNMVNSEFRIGARIIRRTE